MDLHYNANKEDAQEPKSLIYYDTNAHARTLRFALGDGSELFLNYADLISGAFAMDGEAITITLTFAKHIVTLKGYRLSALFDNLALHSLRRLAAVDARYAATEDKGESVVTEIVVKDV